MSEGEGATPNPLLSYSDLLAASEAVLTAHGKELQLRTLVATTIADVSDRQQMLLYLAAWLHEPFYGAVSESMAVITAATSDPTTASFTSRGGLRGGPSPHRY
eukprot:gene11076-31330_t